MKIPSIIKTPRYQRFQVEPRYYDPIKEQIQEREARLKKSIMADKEGADIKEDGYSSAIQGSFTRKKSSKGGSASTMQLVIMLLLAGLIFGYIYYGEWALYIIVTISSVLLYLKMKRIL